MENLYFKDLEELKLFLKGKEKLGEGAEGICYKVNNNVLKVYKELIINYDVKIKTDFLQFKDLEIPHFNFIKNIAYIEKEKYLIGTISKYVKGNVLKFDTLYYEPIDKIIKLIENLLPSIKTLSKEGILVGDIFINNIIYNENNLEFIDTASYCYTYEDIYDLYIYNMKQIMSELMISILDNYYKGMIIEYLSKVNDKYNYKYNDELLLDPISLLKGIKNSLEDYCNMEINNFSDCETVLTKKIKSLSLKK